MARLSDADQGRFPVPRLYSCRAAGARSGAVSRFGEAVVGAARHRHPGVAELLLQVSDDGTRTLSGTRLVHSVDETEEHAAPPHGRGDDHPPRAGVLRLTARFFQEGTRLRLRPFHLVASQDWQHWRSAPTLSSAASDDKVGHPAELRQPGAVRARLDGCYGEDRRLRVRGDRSRPWK